MNSSRLTWPQYSNALCDRHSGYTGVLCGVCIKGFGTTSPFSCSKCLGAHFSQDQLGNLQVQQPGPAGISGLYFAYWFVLTCWLLLCVRFSVPQGLGGSSKGQPLQATGATALQPLNARAASETIPEECAFKAADADEPEQGTSPQHQQPQSPSQKPTTGLRGSTDPQPSKAIDITKVSRAVCRLLMLIDCRSAAVCNCRLHVAITGSSSCSCSSSSAESGSPFYAAATSVTLVVLDH